MNMDRIIDSYNALARTVPEKLPENLRHSLVEHRGELPEWYRIRESDMETLRLVMDAWCSFRVKIVGGEQIYDRRVASPEVITDGSGWVWMRLLEDDWADLLRILIRMMDRLDMDRIMKATQGRE